MMLTFRSRGVSDRHAGDVLICDEGQSVDESGAPVENAHGRIATTAPRNRGEEEAVTPPAGGWKRLPESALILGPARQGSIGRLVWALSSGADWMQRKALLEAAPRSRPQQGNERKAGELIFSAGLVGARAFHETRALRGDHRNTSDGKKWQPSGLQARRAYIWRRSPWAQRHGGKRLPKRMGAYINAGEVRTGEVHAGEMHKASMKTCERRERPPKKAPRGIEGAGGERKDINERTHNYSCASSRLGGRLANVSRIVVVSRVVVHFAEVATAVDGG
ncbi:hypothetical protein C8J57DRAFT_1229811 [Mycena rebaudengoi]|nr:hypothetical protein C8J57DRAFT_1229811 [Mycena rebaudengoi]